MRVGYVSGPADADRIYEDIQSKRPKVYFGTNYMRQFLLLMDDLGAEAWIETWHAGAKYRRRIDLHVFNNVPEKEASGAGFHIRQVRLLSGMLWRLARFRPDIIVLTGKQEYWWVLLPLRLMGTRFVASYHSVIWPPFHSLKMHYKALLFINSSLMLRNLSAVVSTAKRITDQFTQSVGRRARKIPVFEHLPGWEAQDFEGIAPANEEKHPFEVIFMGRVERDKGVYDLLEIASQLKHDRPGEFGFHFCGDGTELANLRTTVEQRQLGDVAHVHGYCQPDRIKTVMGKCHLAVVPTRSDFPAGFEMTCAEAVLSGRPLITSAVAPAIDYLRPAAIEVAPDDIAGYKQAILKMKDAPQLYDDKRAACYQLQSQFFEYKNSWDHAMRQAFAAVLPTVSPRPE